MPLDWRELKKTDARAALFELLKDLRVEYSLIEHKESGRTSESAADATGEDRANIVKSMLLKSGKSGYVGVIVGGNRMVDFGKVRERAGAGGKFSLARPDEVKAALGFEIGGVPPFAFYMGGIAAFVDAAVMGKGHVVGAAGDEFSGIRFSPKEFAKVGYSVGEVSK
jgi:prolyl-tRNA editing enzyme YbaK/EbsC (Cys-tRNA(Pro) deacylase)